LPQILTTWQWWTNPSIKALVIEHPRRAGWQLIDTPALFEPASTVYRFKETEPAEKATTFMVKEELMQDRRS